jgi:hypothetical protein
MPATRATHPALLNRKWGDVSGNGGKLIHKPAHETLNIKRKVAAKILRLFDQRKIDKGRYLELADAWGKNLTRRCDRIDS